LFPIIKSAFSCEVTSSFAVFTPKNFVIVLIPFSSAISATLEEGSTPKTGIFFSAKYCNN